jgi:membrane associated rhomboid family serine protease
VFPISDTVRTQVRPLLTLLLIAANVGVFFGWQPQSGTTEEIVFLYERAAIACELTGGDPLQIGEITTGRCADFEGGRVPFPEKQVELSVLVSLFLHGGLLHLAGNMWFLWIFGNNVEEAFGHIGYAALYLGAGIIATLGFVALHPQDTTPLIGASGAIAGVLGSYAVLFPRHPVLALLFFTMLPVPAFVFLGLWFLGQFMVVEPGVAWEAHVAGFLAGVLVTLPLRGAILERLRRRQRARSRFAL